MSIQTTRWITRENAMNRISFIYKLVQDENYGALVDSSHEDGIDFFSHKFEELDISNMERWPDSMLEDVMDKMFYRYSLFDNYFIGTDYGYQD